MERKAEIIGELKQERLVQGAAAYILSKKLGFHKEALGDWENLRKEPTFSNFILWVTRMGFELRLTFPDAAYRVYTARGAMRLMRERSKSFPARKQDLSAALGVSRTVTYRWMASRTFPTVTHFFEWVDLLGGAASLVRVQSDTRP